MQVIHRGKLARQKPTDSPSASQLSLSLEMECIAPHVHCSYTKDLHQLLSIFNFVWFSAECKN